MFVVSEQAIRNPPVVLLYRPNVLGIRCVRVSFALNHPNPATVRTVLNRFRRHNGRPPPLPRDERSGIHDV